VVVAVNTPVGNVPLIPFAPLQPATPDPVHAVALVETHDSVEALPLVTADGEADKFAVGTMFTVVLATALVPPGPVHVREKIADVDSVPVLCVPLAAFVPFQPPVAEHDVALVELQVRVAVPPLAILVGFAVNMTVGMLAATVTIAVVGTLVPPGPAQVREYVVVPANAAVVREPLAARGPLQPPVAAHDVALVELQVSIDVPPLAIVGGVAVNMTVGTGFAATVTVAVTAAVVPPGPVQVSEYEAPAVKALVSCDPLVAKVPPQPPEAVHDVALVELHAKVATPPLLTDVGDALKETVGAGGDWVKGTDPEPPQAANVNAAPAANAVFKIRMR
jgi:hypothetical protein